MKKHVIVIHFGEQLKMITLRATYYKKNVSWKKKKINDKRRKKKKNHNWKKRKKQKKQ